MKKITFFSIFVLIFIFSAPIFIFGKTEKIYLNFDQVEIKDLVKFLAKELGKNVVYDETLRGKITIISKKPVSKETAWQMIAEALQLLGAMIYEEKGYIKIVASRRIRERTPQINVQTDLPNEPCILIYAISHLNPTKVLSITKPLLSPKALALTIPGTSIVIFRDYAENLARIKQLLDTIEKTSAVPEVKTFRLKHISVEDFYRDILPIIRTFCKERGFTCQMTKNLPTNTLIVYGNKEVFKKIENLIKTLDVSTEYQERQFYVIHLKYSSAEKLDKVLKNLNLSRIQLEQKTLKKRIPYKTGLRISADKSSNALIIYATPQEFEKLKKLIDKLDVQPKQVLLATTIVEVSLSKLKDLGIRWQILGTYGGAAFGGVSQMDLFSAITQNKLIIGAFSPHQYQITIGKDTLFFPELLFLFNLSEEDASFRILSNPRILTLDNHEAMIKVGQSVPYTTGITYQSNALPTVSFEYKDVGLELTITPHITGDSVRLKIHQIIQEVSQVYRAQQGSIDFVAPVTSKREISSEVIVKNGQTVVLGGLVSRKQRDSVIKIPGLSKIPLLGYLFRSSKKETDRTTLFIFITPYIISSPEELKQITEEYRLLSEDIKKLLEFKEKNKLP